MCRTMSETQIVGFDTQRLKVSDSRALFRIPLSPGCIFEQDNNEPPRGKTNNVVSEQVLHKPGCTATEAG